MEDHCNNGMCGHRSTVSLAGFCTYFEPYDRRKGQDRSRTNIYIPYIFLDDHSFYGNNHGIHIFIFVQKHRNGTGSNNYNGFDKVLDPCIFVAYLILGAAMIDLIIVIARGKTKLKRSDAFITPLAFLFIIVDIRIYVWYNDNSRRKGG